MDRSLPAVLVLPEGRFPSVMLAGGSSLPWPLTSRVPQGSLLSRTLLNISMKPLKEANLRFGLGCYQHAQFSLGLPADLRDAAEPLKWCLEVVERGVRAHKLKRNPDKTELLLVWGG